MKIEQQYRNDPTFHALVATLRDFIRERNYSYVELKDAVGIACELQEQEMDYERWLNVQK